MRTLTNDEVVERAIELMYPAKVWDALVPARKRYIWGRTLELLEVTDRVEHLNQELDEALSDDKDWYVQVYQGDDK